jgi:hypothetical protein
VGRSRTQKMKINNPQPQTGAQDIFYMSLEEAKAALTDKYEFLADRYEQKFPKHKGLS